ncbi:glutamine amidotransferase [Micromonospora sp. NBC_00421]|uniref:glutamine amidotransferase n=1 Tax=Micromonospora sp. NBC_00421 TaxID=2975976 RepID=UPI002E1C8BA7
MKVLLLGESWFIHLIHQKGFDSFTNSEYQEGGHEFKAALLAQGWEVDHVPAHRIAERMPTTADGLRQYDCIVISDVGANTFLLTPNVFSNSASEPNRLTALRDYVETGGALLMVGGYLSFAGIEGKARYGQSPLADILPVELLTTDDRVEVPEAIPPRVLGVHPALPDGQQQWPGLLGYNRTRQRPEGKVLVEVGADPLIAVRQVGAGRTGVFTSDLAPHWAPPPFLAWPDYPQLWVRLISWLAARD